MVRPSTLLVGRRPALLLGLPLLVFDMLVLLPATGMPTWAVTSRAVCASSSLALWMSFRPWTRVFFHLGPAVKFATHTIFHK